jgi:hypothetical protein
MQALSGALEACVEEPRSGIVLVTAAAGLGKSRLIAELCAKKPAPVEAWVGDGDALSAGTPLGPIARALRAAARIQDGEPRGEQWRKLEARVRRSVPEPDAERVSEFLAELVGAPRQEGSVQLAAARRDPVLMSDQMLRAFIDLVAAETRAHPLLIVLEDMHWGDSTTLSYVNEAVSTLRDRPLMSSPGRPRRSSCFPICELADLLDMRLKAPRRAGARQMRARRSRQQRTVQQLVRERTAIRFPGEAGAGGGRRGRDARHRDRHAEARLEGLGPCAACRAAACSASRSGRTASWRCSEAPSGRRCRQLARRSGAAKIPRAMPAVAIAGGVDSAPPRAAPDRPT